MIDDRCQTDPKPSLLRTLSEQQQVRLTEILDDYLRQLEGRAAPSREELIAAYPELGDALKLYLEKLEDLHRMADGDRPLGSDLCGKILGDYRLEDEIGRGGMGIVFAAQQQSLNRSVAVKLLPMAAMLESKYIERFRNEARAAAQLEHPNIVPVYTVGEEGGIHYFAMRRIDGQSLDQRIAAHNDRETHPPTKAALRQFADIAEALHTAHEYGVVHRDIKPSNLLLDDTGKLWVADFGLARFQDERALTGTGEMIGTMRYMSPEQALGRSELVDHRTDIYSLGATLYELLTGEPAVAGEEGPNLLRVIATQPPEHLRRKRPDLPRDLQTVVEKAMARHRDDRYPSAQAFADDLRRVVAGEPIAAKLVSPLVLAGRWCVVHTELVSVAVVLLAILGLGLSAGSYAVNKMIADERDQAEASLRRLHALERERAATIDQLALLPGVEALRQKMIPSSLRYYQEFAQTAGNDPRMQDELANAYTRMGTLSEDLGRTAEAVIYYEQAESLLEQLVHQPTAPQEFELHRRENLNHLSMAMDKVGRGEEAVALLADSVQQSRAHPKSALSGAHAVEYGLTENNYGLLLQKSGRRAEAKTAFQNAIDVLEKLHAQNPEDQEAARGLGAALHNLGAFYALDTSGAADERALELLEQGLTIQLATAQQAQNRLRASLDLVTTYLSLGNWHLARKNPFRAADAFDRAAKIGRRLVEISPQVDSYRRDFAVCLCNLGMSRYQQGEYQLAKDALKESIHHFRALLAAFPEHTGLQSSLGIALNNQGIVLQHLGEPEAAEEAYTRAATLLEATKRVAPSPIDSQALEKVYVNHVRMLKKAGREAEANQILQRQLALLPTEKDEP